MDKIQIKIEYRNEETIQVKISGVDLSLMASLRRSAIQEVECMTMENLEILHNSSNIDDEKLAHRLGQIPFTSQDAKKYCFADKCSCQGGVCEKCAVEYTLHVKNVDAHKTRDVTTIDLKPRNESTTVRPTHTDPTGKDDNHSLFICSLLPEQELSFNGIIRKGTVKKEKHHKYQAVSLVGLKYPAIIKLNQEKLKKLTADEKKKIVRQCVDNIFKYDEVKDIFETTEDPNDCRSCTHNEKSMEMVASFGQPDAIEIIPKMDYFLLTINSNGCLKPEEILLWSIEAFLENLKKIHYSLSVCQQRLVL